VGLLVVSDSRGTMEKPDRCIPAVSGFLKENGFELVRTEICKDEMEQIREILKEWADKKNLEVILTSGGTGVSPRDVTPEATRPLLDREIPGIPEAMRAASMKKSAFGLVSRGVAGLIGDILVINLPGSPKAAVENLEAVYKAIEHIVKKAAGDPTECAPNLE
jgi:molybdenum cofactor synthesis domain-containing protein